MTITAADAAWWASAFCVLFTLRCAFAFAHRHADVFLALCVYAGQFAVLIVFYRGEQHNTLLPALAGYFSAVAGFLLVRCRHARAKKPHPARFEEATASASPSRMPGVDTHEVSSPEAAKHESDHTRALRVRPSEQAVVLLLLLIAFPRILASSCGAVASDLHEPVANLCVAVLLDTFGYFTLYRAIAVSYPTETWKRRSLSAPLMLYWLMNIAFSAWQIYKAIAHGAKPAMDDASAYAFAIMKVITVVTFVPGILAPYESFVKKTWPERLLVFFHLEED
jgi:hypothetical protein